MSLVYPELHRIAERHLRGERPGHTLQPTALVHEAYLRFAQQQPGKEWTDRTHFFAVAARAYSLTLKRLGAVEIVAGALDDSERDYRAALAIEESWAPRGAGNIRWPFELTYSLSDLAFLRSKQGDDAGAVVLWMRALDGRRRAAAADPQNMRIQRGVASLEFRLGAAHARGTAATAGGDRPHRVGAHRVGECADAGAGTAEEVRRHRHASGMSVSVPLCST